MGQHTLFHTVTDIPFNKVAHSIRRLALENTFVDIRINLTVSDDMPFGKSLIFFGRSCFLGRPGLTALFLSSRRWCLRDILGCCGVRPRRLAMTTSHLLQETVDLGLHAATLISRLGIGSLPPTAATILDLVGNPADQRYRAHNQWQQVAKIGSQQTHGRYPWFNR